MRLLKGIAIGMGAGAVFVSGVMGGIWFGQHYRVVPISVHPQTMPTAAAPTQAPADSPVAAKGTAPAPSAAASSAGPFDYQFAAGEMARYGLMADIEGTGIDLGKGANVALNLNLEMTLLTENVDASGTGSLRLDFTSLDMQGDFMGGPVELHQNADRTFFQMNSRTMIDTSAGIDAGQIPQLEFFKQPVRMKVASNGDILNVAGTQGFEQILAPVMQLAPQELGTSGDPNTQWTSQFLMPIPGLSDGLKTVVQNTLAGYQMIGNRNCAVVWQELSSNESGGTLSFPASALGEALGISMPVLNLKGTNVVYFDAGNGKLVRCDMDLNLKLKIGPTIKPLTDLLQAYGDVLGDAAGAGRQKTPAASEESQDIGAEIKASLYLEE